MKPQEEEQNQDTSNRRPDFNIKAGGDFVGSAWLNDGQFGPYIACVLKETAQSQDRLYLYPRKGKENILPNPENN